jgi:1,4-alpha-glucan branching enzyme
MAKPRRTSKPRGPAQALAPQQSVTTEVTLLSDEDLYYFNEGTHSRLYEKLGAHPLTVEETRGTYFAVWAPNAAHVCDGRF